MPSEQRTLLGFRDSFFAFEMEEGLFSLKLKGDSFWDYIRYNVFNELAIRHKYIVPYFLPSMPMSEGLAHRARITSLCKESPYLLAGIAKTLSFSCPHECPYDLIFFDNEIKRLIDGKWVDFRGYPFVKNLSASVKTLVVDPSTLDESIKGVYPCDVVNFRTEYLRSTLMARLTVFSRKEMNQLEELNKKIENTHRHRVQLSHYIRSSFLPQHYNRRWLRKLFKSCSPKLVGILNDGRKKAVIDTAHSMGIPVFELQHGSTSPMDIYTSYPPDIACSNISTLPDYVLTFGEYWNDKYNHPAYKIPVGFPFFEMSRDCVSKEQAGNKKENSVICISNAGREMADFLVALSKRLPAFTFYFKLRPEEYDCWTSLYSSSLRDAENIRVIDNNDIHLYEYFVRCPYLLAINSTAIYEGLALGTIPLIYRGAYHEDVLDLVHSEYAFLVESPEQAGDILAQSRVPSQFSNQIGVKFFLDNSPLRMRNVISDLLSEKNLQIRLS